uniref:NADH-ubiquinone oxidoreductase chain 2 n=1 Tax=Tetragnatha versicolor TaxID=156854 RepID=A0A2I6BYS3_9ARAC|nr:NADH dehydrogenase subunit 2 [Tetragnatha versicolor]
MSFFSPMFGLMYFSSFLMVLGGDSWFLLWVGLEINMISFILLVYGKKISSIEVCLKYFFIQGLGSAVLLMVMILKGKFLSEIVLLILSYKMGAGPFFFWFPSFCEGISWYSCILVMSLQKVVPLLFAGMFMCMFVWSLLLLSMMIGVMGCFSEVKLKKFFAFSSVHYVGWMFLCVGVDMYLWMLYLLGYTLILMGVLMSVGFNENIFLSDVMKMKSPGLFIFSMLNIGGMPPMLGFFLKWWVFLKVLDFSVGIVWIIVIFAVLMFYIYMRLVYSILLNLSYMPYFSLRKMKHMIKGGKEWLYMVAMIFSPVLGWALL